MNLQNSKYAYHQYEKYVLHIYEHLYLLLARNKYYLRHENAYQSQDIVFHSYEHNMQMWLHKDLRQL